MDLLALFPNIMGLTPQVWFPNAVLLVAYGFIIWDRVPKVVVALLGASILLMTKVMTQEEALSFVDFNVIALLVGMMILVNILRQTGALNALALLAVRQSRGNGVRLMLLLALVTALISALLDNVTSVLLMGTVTVSIAHHLRINPVPLLIAEAMASNVGGTATLIGDPPNIMIGSAAGLNFNDFLIHLAPVVLLAILPATLSTLVWVYRKELVLSFEAKRAMLRLSTEGVITDKPLMFKALLALSAVILGFLFHHKLGLEAGTIALAGAAVLMIFESATSIWDDVEWTTLFFFIGLFIIIGAVEQSGTLEWMAQSLITITQGNYNAMAFVLLWVSGILSAAVDNIPYTATMIPLVQSLKGIDPVQFQNLNPLWWSLALGACLGGNGTIIGATANVLVADMAHRQGHPIRFVEFFKVGSLLMVISLTICSVYIWFRYLAS